MGLINLAYAKLDPTLAKLTDPVISDLIEVSSSIVEKWCRRKFAKADYTELLDGDNRRRLMVKNHPVNTVTSIAAVNPADDAVTNFDNTQFIFKRSGIIQLKPSVAGWFFKGFQNITVVYNAGFSETHPTVKLATRMVMVWIYGDTGQGRLLKEKMGDYEAMFAVSTSDQDLPNNIVAILKQFRTGTLVGGVRSQI